ncbi:MAG: LytR C-terminal domain-containing protein [Bifidobacteriaceae bacterium]|jgi:hypothetical protein|nr:LytR C-terminal domain-containing protein [Bifidobacteriaceae bacterium]
MARTVESGNGEENNLKEADANADIQDEQRVKASFFAGTDLKSLLANMENVASNDPTTVQKTVPDITESKHVVEDLEPNGKKDFPVSPVDALDMTLKNDVDALETYDEDETVSLQDSALLDNQDETILSDAVFDEKSQLNSDYPYSDDKFDDLITGPIAVHRAPRVLGRYIFTIIISALLGAALAIGVFVFLYRSTIFAPQTNTPPQATETPVAVPTATPTIETVVTETPEPVQAVNKEVKIQIMNATETAGLAAEKVALLNENGYKNGSAENFTGTLPNQSTVFYGDDEDKATADDIAKILGYTAEKSNLAKGAIEVVIV